MLKRIDYVLAMIFAVLIAVLLVEFFTNDAFFSWAFERHQNAASWVARPLLLIPFCFFAWKRSLAGIMATLLAILTSMFWFPVPENPDQTIIVFLEMERDLLSKGWLSDNTIGALAVVIYCVALATAFWRRSWIIGLAVASAGAILKISWSIFSSPEVGEVVVPFALGGLAILIAVVWIGVRFAQR